MPCYSFSHANCGIGNRLKNINNSVCSKCYGNKGFYRLYTKKLNDKTDKIINDLDNLEKELIDEISKKEKSGYFRFFDKGDILSMEHLQSIMNICNALPNIQFWIPTKSIDILRDYIKNNGNIPKNVTIRISSFMLNKTMKLDKILHCLPIASVYDRDNIKNKNNDAFLCKTNEKDNCGNCRACWSKSIREVIYEKH